MTTELTPAAVRDDMAWVPGGTFLMGSDRHYAEEAPAHPVIVDGFWIDRHPVCNRQFERFERATGHLTLAELAPDPADYQSCWSPPRPSSARRRNRSISETRIAVGPSSPARTVIRRDSAARSSSPRAAPISTRPTSARATSRRRAWLK